MEISRFYSYKATVPQDDKTRLKRYGASQVRSKRTMGLENYAYRELEALQSYGARQLGPRELWG